MHFFDFSDDASHFDSHASDLHGFDDIGDHHYLDPLHTGSHWDLPPDPHLNPLTQPMYVPEDMAHHIPHIPTDIPGVENAAHSIPHAPNHGAGIKEVIDEALHKAHEAHEAEEILHGMEKESHHAHAPKVSKPLANPVEKAATGKWVESVKRFARDEAWMGKKGMAVVGAVIAIGATVYGVKKHTARNAELAAAVEGRSEGRNL